MTAATIRAETGVAASRLHARLSAGEQSKAAPAAAGGGIAGRRVRESAAKAGATGAATGAGPGRPRLFAAAIMIGEWV